MPGGERKLFPNWRRMCLMGNEGHHVLGENSVLFTGIFCLSNEFLAKLSSTSFTFSQTDSGNSSVSGEAREEYSLVAAICWANLTGIERWGVIENEMIGELLWRNVEKKSGDIK